MENFTPKELWLKACRFDGIDPNSKFIVFSDKNPFTEKYNRAMSLYLMAEEYYRKQHGGK